MELVDYPQAIKVASQQYLSPDQQVTQLQKEAERLKLEIEQSVAFDTTLKNQNQRDCRRLQILQHHVEYQEIVAQLETARYARNSARTYSCRSTNRR